MQHIWKLFSVLLHPCRKIKRIWYLEMGLNHVHCWKSVNIRDIPTADQIQSAKICPNFHFQGGYWRPTQIQSAKICPNFHFFGGRGYSRPTFLKYLSGGHSRNFEPEILATGMCYCITDSLSHTMYVKTN